MIMNIDHGGKYIIYADDSSIFFEASEVTEDDNGLK